MSWRGFLPAQNNAAARNRRPPLDEFRIADE